MKDEQGVKTTWMIFAAGEPVESFDVEAEAVKTLVQMVHEDPNGGTDLALVGYSEGELAGKYVWVRTPEDI